MSELEIIKSYIIDPVPLAQLIESKASPYLIQSLLSNAKIDDRIATVYSNVIINKRYLSPEPYEFKMPTLGIEIIKAYIDRLITVNSAWVLHNKPSIQDAIGKYVNDDYKDSIEVFELLEDLLLDLKTDIKEFIGPSKWDIHFLRTRKNDIVIEKSVDYRVYFYNQYHQGNLIS